MTVRRALAATVVLALLAFTGTAGAAEPRLTVTKPKLRAALKCTPGVKDATRTSALRAWRLRGEVLMMAGSSDLGGLTWHGPRRS